MRTYKALTMLGLFGCIVTLAFGQKISGEIRSKSTQQPIAGATILAARNQQGTSSDVNGKFSIDLQGAKTIQVSSVGYSSQTVNITEALDYTVELEPSDASLEQVVVVGYGTQKKANLTGAVTVVDVTKTFGSRPLTDPAKALQGVVPGLTIQYGNGGLTAGASINIRGIGSINGSSRPLLLVDNVETTDLSIINPNDIESISVLKDAASTSIYGARAAFGVVLIKTKSGKKNQKMTVSYNNNFSWSQTTSVPEFSDPVPELDGLIQAANRSGLTAETFGMNFVKLRNGIINWKEKYAGKNGLEMVKGEDWDIDAVDGRAYFFKVWDPKKEMLNKFTFSQQHNLSIQGGGEKIGYYLSGGYSNDGGIFKMNSDAVEKYNVTVGLNVSPTKWLDLNVRALNRNFSYNYPYAYQDYWYYFWRWRGFYPFGTYQGNYFRTNSAFMNGASKSNATSNYQRIDLGATIKINKNLSIKADYTLSRDNVLRHETGGPVLAWDYWTAGTLALADIASAASNATTYTSGRMLINTFNAYATYQGKLDDHNLKLTAGINAEKDETINFFAAKRGLLDPSQGEIALTYGDASTGVTGSGVTGWPTNGHGVASIYRSSSTGVVRQRHV